jgi:hypothetical protein
MARQIDGTLYAWAEKVLPGNCARGVPFLERLVDRRDDGNDLGTKQNKECNHYNASAHRPVYTS